MAHLISHQNFFFFLISLFSYVVNGRKTLRFCSLFKMTDVFFFLNLEAGRPVLMLQWFSLLNAIITWILFIKVLLLNCC